MDIQIFHHEMQVDYFIRVLGDLDKFNSGTGHCYVPAFFNMWQRPGVTPSCLGILLCTGSSNVLTLHSWESCSHSRVDHLIYVAGIDNNIMCFFLIGV